MLAEASSLLARKEKVLKISEQTEIFFVKTNKKNYR